MKLKFKKFKIENNKLSYILKINKDPKNYYYTEIEDLLKSIPSKIILKSEASDINQLIDEIKEFKKELVDVKKWKQNQ